MMGGDWGWGGHMLFGWFSMVLFWGGLAVVIVLLVRWLGRGDSAAGDVRRKSAVDILEERFARGEIDREEFEERRRLLSER